MKTMAGRRARHALGAETTVDSREARRVAGAVAKSTPVLGYGCPAIGWPHHLRVHIPTPRAEDVILVEDFGIAGHGPGGTDEVERCRLARARWTFIAEPVKRAFNERLRAADLPPARWATGDNKVERMLGLELLALAWAVSAADEVDLPAVLASWLAMRPEERWWLAGRASMNPTPRVTRGLALLMSAGPTAGGAARPTQPARPKKQLPLFVEAKSSI